MLTPRHQALVATLTGMTLGVAVFGAVLLLNRDPRTEAAAGVVTTSSPVKPTPAPSTMSDGRLTPLQPDDVADLLDLLWSDTSTVVIVSTDLSHYLDYAAAVECDRRTAQAVEQRAEPFRQEQDGQ